MGHAAHEGIQHGKVKFTAADFWAIDCHANLLLVTPTFRVLACDIEPVCRSLCLLPRICAKCRCHGIESAEQLVHLIRRDLHRLDPDLWTESLRCLHPLRIIPVDECDER